MDWKCCNGQQSHPFESFHFPWRIAFVGHAVMPNDSPQPKKIPRLNSIDDFYSSKKARRDDNINSKSYNRRVESNQNPCMRIMKCCWRLQKYTKEVPFCRKLVGTANDHYGHSILNHERIEETNVLEFFLNPSQVSYSWQTQLTHTSHTHTY